MLSMGITPKEYKRKLSRARRPGSRLYREMHGRVTPSLSREDRVMLDMQPSERRYVRAGNTHSIQRQWVGTARQTELGSPTM